MRGQLLAVLFDCLNEFAFTWWLLLWWVVAVAVLVAPLLVFTFFLNDFLKPCTLFLLASLLLVPVVWLVFDDEVRFDRDEVVAESSMPPLLDGEGCERSIKFLNFSLLSNNLWMRCWASSSCSVTYLCRWELAYVWKRIIKLDWKKIELKSFYCTSCTKFFS